jgi:hypothetical protein
MKDTPEIFANLLGFGPGPLFAQDRGEAEGLSRFLRQTIKARKAGGSPGGVHSPDKTEERGARARLHPAARASQQRVARKDSLAPLVPVAATGPPLPP